MAAPPVRRGPDCNGSLVLRLGCFGVRDCHTASVPTLVQLFSVQSKLTISVQIKMTIHFSRPFCKRSAPVCRSVCIGMYICVCPFYSLFILCDAHVVPTCVPKCVLAPLVLFMTNHSIKSPVPRYFSTARLFSARLHLAGSLVFVSRPLPLPSSCTRHPRHMPLNSAS